MEQSWTMIIVSLVAVVFVFLFAVKKLGHQVQYLVGDRLKNLVDKFTNTKFKGLISGFVATTALQSSTAFTVMLVSFVDAGIIPFANSIPMIIGSNIGSTITTQLIAFKILNIAPYLLVIGFILMNLKHRYQRFGKPIFYFGLVFSCLFIISVLAGSFKESAILISLVEKTSNLFVAISIGFILVNILQSSSITTSIIVIFAATGLLTFYQAFGLVLGANIGTTTTALLASLVTGKQGKRVAMTHFFYNLIGAIIFLPFVGVFIKLMMKLPIGIAGQVAASHLIYNLIIAIIFFFAIKPLELLVHKVVK
ncbi:MAG TPA: Na/Pi symporter [Candidatus Paceibacterota bacterium]|nr:Na/Pi symporter [Candidatus Paceibacterota bacterium]